MKHSFLIIVTLFSMVFVCHPKKTENRIQCTVYGEVVNPGVQALPHSATLMHAISIANPDPFNHAKYAFLIRNESLTLISMRDIEKNPEKDVKLQNGDIIICLRKDYDPSKHRFEFS